LQVVSFQHEVLAQRLEGNSGVILVAYLFGFFVFTDYLPGMEHWSLDEPLRAVSFIALFAIAFASVYGYQKQMLDMDKQLVFEETPYSTF